MPDLISPEYLALLKELHKADPTFGGGSGKRRKKIRALGYADILDYGCGKGKLDLPGIKKYDPAVVKFSAEPESADLVICIDVLEHIEPLLIDNVLAHMKSKMKKVGYFTIALNKASKKLSNGENAHILLRSKEWWLEKIGEFFKIQTIGEIRGRRQKVELELFVTFD